MTQGSFSPRLYNEDLAPANDRRWGAFSVFNVWTSDVHSLYGYFLAASLFLVAGTTWKFLIGISLGSVLIYGLMTLVGNAGVDTGVPYPVLARAAFGTFGANVPALVRAVVATFWYGAQTSAAAGALLAFLVRFDALRTIHRTVHLLGHSGLDVACYLLVWLGQLVIIRRGMETVRKFQDFAGPLVWIMMLLCTVLLTVKAGSVSFSVAMTPAELAATARAATGLDVVPGSLSAVMAIAATWTTYFAALFLNFCDFSRFTASKAVLRRGNLWGLPVNLIAFSLIAALTTTSANKVYGEVLLEPSAIAAKFDSLALVFLAAVTFAVATLGINVVANFVSPAFDFANIAPKYISFKRGGLIAALIALALYPFHPWDNAPGFVIALGSAMGPLFGIIVVDYYLVRRGRIDVADLYREHGAYRFKGGWNPRAFLATAVGVVASSPAVFAKSLGPYAWFVGAGLSAVTYLALARLTDSGAKRSPSA